MAFATGMRVDSLRLAHRRLQCHLLELAITARENLDDTRIETGSGFRRDLGHGFIERQCAAVLAVRGKGVEAIDGGQNARADRNFFAFQPIRDNRSRPSFS